MKLSSQTLFDAIETNSIEVVKAYLELGGDPNQDLGDIDFQPYNGAPAERRTTLSTSSTVIRVLQFRVPLNAGPFGSAATPFEGNGFGPFGPFEKFKLKGLHMAVVNCFRYTSVGGEHWETAVALLDAFLQAGADVHYKSSLVVVDSSNLPNTRAGHKYSPLGLAVALKSHVMHDSNARPRFDMVITKIVSSVTGGPPKALKEPSTAPVPTSVVDTYKNLLHSSKGSDIKFVCEDGQEFPAHKIVLAAASPYFCTVFEGPWAENHSDGTWATSHPAHIIQAVLAFVYTGDLKTSLDPMEMLSIAGEYDIPSLKDVAVYHCIASVDDTNLMEMLQLAHLFQIGYLKKACFDYAKRNPTLLLTSAHVISSNLPNENPDLWAEFSAAVGSDGDSTHDT